MSGLAVWFEFASTYSYPAVMRVETAATAAGIGIVWRPFLLGPIFGAQGWTDSPFNLYPVKGRYMWRDLERTCAALGLPWRQPSQFPRRGLLAARVAIAAEDTAWVGAFVRGIYHANFGADRDIADPAVVAEVLASVGAPADALAAADTAETKAALRARTDEAVTLGIFGAPTFVTGDGELFWGNDRLEAAIGWHCAHALGPA